MRKRGERCARSRSMPRPGFWVLPLVKHWGKSCAGAWLALCLLVAGCGAGPTALVATARAEVTQGQFRLVFELPRTDWRASDSITGEATLSLIWPGGVDLGAWNDGPFAFEFAEVGGSRDVKPMARFAQCVRYRLDASQPLSSPIKKSGGWSADEPNASFYDSFFADPLVHLPAGDWTITAIAIFTEGWPCDPSDLITLRAQVLMHVTA